MDMRRIRSTIMTTRKIKEALMKLTYPFDGSYPITQRFGERITDPKGHTGVDFALPKGTPLLAASKIGRASCRERV